MLAKVLTASLVLQDGEEYACKMGQTAPSPTMMSAGTFFAHDEDAWSRDHLFVGAQLADRRRARPQTHNVPMRVRRGMQALRPRQQQANSGRRIHTKSISSSICNSLSGQLSPARFMSSLTVLFSAAMSSARPRMRVLAATPLRSARCQRQVDLCPGILGHTMEQLVLFIMRACIDADLDPRLGSDDVFAGILTKGVVDGPAALEQRLDGLRSGDRDRLAHNDRSLGARGECRCAPTFLALLRQRGRLATANAEVGIVSGSAQDGWKAATDSRLCRADKGGPGGADGQPTETSLRKWSDCDANRLIVLPLAPRFWRHATRPGPARTQSQRRAQPHCTRASARRHCARRASAPVCARPGPARQLPAASPRPQTRAPTPASAARRATARWKRHQTAGRATSAQTRSGLLR